ncbi:MAG: ATP-binding cassette domain-containing protein [Solirubrobacteraceae bacterium]
MQSAIEASALEKTYPPGIAAVAGVSLSVPAGTIFALLGPNGAGKSTTVRILCTLTRPDSGRALVCGIDALAHPMRVRHAIGVVGQKHGADMEATGRENLVLQGEFYGLSGHELTQRVAQSLERNGLVEVADRPVKTYSGGMQRRLDLALGLMHRPRVLFLDEPTTGLDPEARMEMWREIERLAAEDGMTILLTTHYMEEADHLASRVAIIDRGRIVVEGAPAELKAGLHGDSIQIELIEPAAAAANAALARVAGLSEIELAGRTLRARAPDGSGTIPGVLAALETHGLKVASVTLARPSLDDVYLRHAGRAFREADARPKEVAA